MTTIICTAIKDETWEAWTPHSPGVTAHAEAEHTAINRLIELLREQFGAGIKWDETATPPTDSGVITRNITGVWPNQDQIIKPAGNDVGPTVEPTQ